MWFLLLDNKKGKQMIIDCHGHMGFFQTLGIRKSIDEIIRGLDRAGVDIFCVSHTECFYYDFYEGNDEMLAAVRRYPRRLAGYVCVNPRHGEKSLNEIRRCLSQKGVVGVKFFFTQPLFKVDDPCMYPIFEIISKESVPVLIGDIGKPDDMDRLYSMAEHYPEAKIIHAHMGGTSGGDIMGAILRARRHPNVYLDTASSDTSSKMVEKAVKFVGAERVLFGSDFPLLNIHGQIAKVKGAGISDREKELILGENMFSMIEPRMLR